MAVALRIAISCSQRSAGRQRGGTLLGVVIGFALGVTIAALIAFALTKSSNPFDAKSGKTDPASPHVSGSEREPAKSGEPRFDFSKILPGIEGRRSQEGGATEKATVTAPNVGNTPPPEKSGKYYLQAGAYQNAADAEDQRAKLALMGVEASMQTVAIPDKGTLNRVRLGPFDTVDEMNQIKADLLKRGVTTAVIKMP